MRGWLLTLLASSSLLLGCGGGATRTCVDGRTVECACAGGRTGTQICDRGAYLPCACGAGGVDGGQGDGGGMDVAPPTTGCASNADCDDAIACTFDSCGVGGVCRNLAEDSICGAGRRCDPGVGCVEAGGDAGRDSGAPTMDASVTDSGAGDAGGLDAGPADAGPIDGGPRDAGAPDTGSGTGDVVGDWSAAHQGWVSEFCRCSWESTGFASVAQCETEHSQNTSVLTCARTRLASADDLVVDHFGCLTLAYDEATTCYESVSACEAAGVSSCQTMLDGALALCAEPGSWQPYLAGVDACLGGSFTFCPDTADTFGGTGSAIFSGVTLGAGDHYDGSCGGGTGINDRTHLWGSFVPNWYVIDTEGSDFDTVLYVIDVGESLMCPSGTELACNDDAVMGRPTSRVELWVDVLPRIMIVVEPRTPLSGGRYQVNINARRF